MSQQEYAGWIEGPEECREELRRRGVTLGPESKTSDGVIWNDCNVPDIEAIDNMWGQVIWGLTPCGENASGE